MNTCSAVDSANLDERGQSSTPDELPSRPFQGWDWSEHSNVKQLIDALFKEYAVWYKAQGDRRRIRDPDRIRQHLTHFVLEAFRTYSALPELSMGVHLGKDYYADTGSRYRPRHLSYRMVHNVTEFLVDADCLEMPSGMGAWHPDEFRRRTTRFRATRRLIDLCDDFAISRYMIVPWKNPEVIILRKRKKHRGSPGELAEYTDTPFTRLARRNLENINTFISRHHIDLDITDDQEEALMLRLRGRDDGYIDHTKTRLVRIFNNSSFEQGGRLLRRLVAGYPRGLADIHHNQFQEDGPAGLSPGCTSRSCTPSWEWTPPWPIPMP